jgi:hypothetical protein
MKNGIENLEKAVTSVDEFLNGIDSEIDNFKSSSHFDPNQKVDWKIKDFETEPDNEISVFKKEPPADYPEKDEELLFDDEGSDEPNEDPDEELEEISTSAGAGSYNTPNAFRKTTSADTSGKTGYSDSGEDSKFEKLGYKLASKTDKTFVPTDTIQKQFNKAEKGSPIQRRKLGEDKISLSLASMIKEILDEINEESNEKI